ncbi:MAG TPA: class F sortase [Candidatus Saccharimonadales bacterium]|nr:class F sortase [Candidatus Saccharimonadales bacterium]
MPVQHTPDSPAIKETTVQQVQAAPVINVPVRLTIGSVGTDAIIKPAGLTSDGDMDVDDSIVDVAWYQFGPKPGEKGSAVIAGHYGWVNGQASVFNDLHLLEIGDKVSVYDEKGTELTFVVRKIRKYDPHADATEVFRSTDGKVRLNLITCGGTWVDSADSYSDRLVVFTDLTE